MRLCHGLSCDVHRVLLPALPQSSYKWCNAEHISAVLMCRYTSVASLETLGQAYRQGTELIGHYYEAYLKEAELAADPKAVADAQDGVQILEKDLLIKKMAQPLSKALSIFI